MVDFTKLKVGDKVRVTREFPNYSSKSEIISEIGFSDILESEYVKLETTSLAMWFDYELEYYVSPLEVYLKSKGFNKWEN